MRWPRRRRREEPRPSRADEALADSREQLARERAQRPRWEELAAHLRAIRERNHLAETIERALGEGR